eukprot:1161690-Prymnesium_polylepis.1
MRLKRFVEAAASEAGDGGARSAVRDATSKMAVVRVAGERGVSLEPLLHELELERTEGCLGEVKCFAPYGHVCRAGERGSRTRVGVCTSRPRGHGQIDGPCGHLTILTINDITVPGQPYARQRPGDRTEH